MSTKLFEIDEDEIIAVRGKFKGTFKYFCRGNVFYKRPATKTKKERYVCFRANDGKYKCQVCIMKNEQDKFILDMTEGHDHNEPGDKKKIERIVIQIQKETLEASKLNKLYDDILSHNKNYKNENNYNHENENIENIPVAKKSKIMI